MSNCGLYVPSFLGKTVHCFLISPKAGVRVPFTLLTIWAARLGLKLPVPIYHIFQQYPLYGWASVIIKATCNRYAASNYNWRASCRSTLVVYQFLFSKPPSSSNPFWGTVTEGLAALLQNGITTAGDFMAEVIYTPYLWITFISFKQSLHLFDHKLYYSFALIP